MELSDLAPLAFGLFKWFGYVLVVYAIARSEPLHARQAPARLTARVFGAATVRTGLGIASGILLLRVLDFSSPVGPSPWAIAAVLTGVRLVEWAAAFAFFFPALRPARPLLQAAARGTGVSFLLDIPAAFFTVLLGVNVGAIHMC